MGYAGKACVKIVLSAIEILLFQVTFPKVSFSSLLQNLVDLAGSERAAQTGAEGNGNS